MRALAFQIERDAPTLLRWEIGERAPKPHQVSHLLAHLGIRGERFRRVMDLSENLHDSCWIASTTKEDVLQREAYLALEATATRITEVAPRLVPPLLRTREVATAVAHAGEVHIDQVEAHVATLLDRQRAIPSPRTRLTAFLGTAALTRPIGTVDMFGAQLERLLTRATHPQVDLRVVPQQVGWQADLDQAFTLTETRHTTVAIQHSRRSNTWLYRPEDLRNLTIDIRLMEMNALSPDDTVAYLTKAVHRLHSNGIRHTDPGLDRAG